MGTPYNDDFNVAVTTLINHMKTIYQCSTVFGHNQSDLQNPQASMILDSHKNRLKFILFFPPCGTLDSELPRAYSIAYCTEEIREWMM